MDAIGLSLIAYLLGSISAATLLCRWFKHSDPHTQGSGNPGATNVLRIAGPRTAIIVLIFDAAKGAIPILLGHLMGIEGILLGMVGLAALIGHCYPLWHRFKGGKGVATFLGVILALHLLVGVLALVTWLVIAFITRYASAASLASVYFCPILLAKFTDFGYVIPTLIMAALITYRHWPNILKLKAKQESKIDLNAWKEKLMSQPNRSQHNAKSRDDKPQSKTTDTTSAQKPPTHQPSKPQTPEDTAGKDHDDHDPTAKD